MKFKIGVLVFIAKRLSQSLKNSPLLADILIWWFPKSSFVVDACFMIYSLEIIE